ncbi:MAG: serine hydrolase domain-containing protein [Planctomycetota bacterium]
MLSSLAVTALLFLLPPPASADAPTRAQPTDASVERIRKRGAEHLELLAQKHDLPGASGAVVLPDGTSVAFAHGWADVESERALVPADRMLSGSTGKTFVAASALHLVGAGRLQLDDPASKFLGEEPWFARLPNADDLTLGALLRHRGGLPRYVFEADFWQTAVADPDRVWAPAELLAFVFDKEPLFAVDEGWAYSDTSYIVVGMMIEAVAGVPFYDYAREHLIEPHGLTSTVPSNSRRIAGLAQGYDSAFGHLGVAERLLDDEGVFAFNPQFEWCGGGYASTPTDLARWSCVLYSGAAFGGDYLEALLDTVPAEPLGPGTRYGPGLILRGTKLGELRGHDGIMPGYSTTMGYFPDADIAAAFQVNATGLSLGRPIHEVLVELVEIAREELAAVKVESR